MREISVANIAAQEFSVLLDDKSVVVTLRQRGNRIYADISVDGNQRVRGQILLHGQDILEGGWVELEGKMFIIDQLAQEAAQWQGLGTRWKVVYG